MSAFTQGEKASVGHIAEKHIINMLHMSSKEKPIKRSRKFYDLEWHNRRIEVKSAQICVWRTKSQKHRYNCYGFTGQRGQIEALIRTKSWFAFLLMIRSEPIHIRFVKATDISEHIIHYGTQDKARIRFSVMYKGLTLRQFVKRITRQ